MRLQDVNKLSALGSHNYQGTSNEPPTQLDVTLVQRGASEHLLRGGKAKVLRRFTNGDYVHTAFGQETRWTPHYDVIGSGYCHREEEGLGQPRLERHGATHCMHDEQSRSAQQRAVYRAGATVQT